MRILGFIVGVSLLGLGCQADDPDVPPTSVHTPDEAEAAGDPGVSEDDELARSAALSCDDLQDAAEDLLESYQACDDDADCTFATVEARCLGAFTCQPPVNRGANLAGLRRRAKSLAALYGRRCSDQCIVARCVSPETQRAFCSPETKRCAKAYVPPPAVDASVPEPEPQPDAGSTTDASSADPRFQCDSDADCAVKDVGNCCGYYPRCANVDATFERPSCEGRAGVCGFPTIESCACRQNTCRSLQGGREI